MAARRWTKKTRRQQRWAKWTGQAKQRKDARPWWRPTGQHRLRSYTTGCCWRRLGTILPPLPSRYGWLHRSIFLKVSAPQFSY